MRITTVLAVCLICLGTVIYTLRPRGSESGGSAGVAYVEGADGELIAADQAAKSRDTSKFNAMRDQADAQGLSESEWTRKFALIERSGKKVSSEDLLGQPYVAGFFFSLCPTVCLNQNQKVAQLQSRFDGQKVRFLSISCDPEIDKPAVLREYAKRFDADKDQWLFLTGEMSHIQRVGAEMFSLHVTRRVHAEKFALVDAKGRIAGFYAWADPEQWLTLQTDIEDIIAAGGTFPEPEADKTVADSAGAGSPAVDPEDS